MLVLSEKKAAHRLRPGRLPYRVGLALSIAAGASFQSVQRVAEGRPTRGVTRERILRAAAQMGIELPVPREPPPPAEANAVSLEAP
jgi:hypothetical protein